MHTIIRNTSSAVKVLKTIGLPTLRLFPGFNNVITEHINSYFNNKIAMAIRKESLEFPDYDLDEEQVKEAERARLKNETLNKGSKNLVASVGNLEKNNMSNKKAIDFLIEKVKKLEMELEGKQ